MLGRGMVVCLCLAAGMVSAEPVTPDQVLGSWRVVAAEAEGTTIVTFNPDGSRVVSDGQGDNLEDGWELFGATLSAGEEEFEVYRDGPRLVLNDTVLERFLLNGVALSGKSAGPDLDLTGRLVLLSGVDAEAVVADLSVKALEIAGPAGFAPGAGAPPLVLTLWDTTEPLQSRADGSVFRETEVAFTATDWQMTPERIEFRATEPTWGELVFLGRFSAPAAFALGAGRPLASVAVPGEALITADLLLSGHILRAVPFGPPPPP